ncbi:hypothetical protein F2P44_24880 [Massilia sp. CCM 8695]|uniref:DUF5610 domain-containing protein n=1 Tax=Massilia frigida TaxID=2609281 RepID=A0ABX0NH61_9BURK|nr:hypothetical protein [Massilia frigida]NHZ82489.1 hypothetical protein [Massilia frigida]
MSTSAIGAFSPTATTQASQYRSVPAGAAAKPAAAAPPDGKAFVSAIASALQEIGVADADAADSSASADPASALGDFLNELMESLQSAGGKGGKGPQGPLPGGGGPPPGGGGGGMQSDLASLAGSLTKQAGSETDTDDSDTTGSTARLESSFGKLLGAFGLDSADASSRLGHFLQTLATKLDATRPAGNLINTTA